VPTSDVPDVRTELAFRRSLRASQGRRAAVAARRRRHLTGRRGLALALAGLAVASTGAFAQSAGTTPSPVAAAQQKLGVTADGVSGPQTRAAVRQFQRAHGLTVDGIIGPETLAALGVSDQPTLSQDPPADPDSTDLSAIAQCESGGDPAAISPTGRYRGKYQFSRASWRAVGGTGDPAAAPETEQDQRAAMLLAKQGPKAWPVCSQQA
jgi:peptidoglycan hydrolase-like protein with peptidoglycan-binding domain